MHRLDLGLYSHLIEFRGMESEPMLTPREKFPLPEIFSSEEDRTHDTASRSDSEPNTLPRSYSGPAAHTIALADPFVRHTLPVAGAVAAIFRLPLSLFLKRTQQKVSQSTT